MLIEPPSEVARIQANRPLDQSLGGLFRDEGESHASFERSIEKHFGSDAFHPCLISQWFMLDCVSVTKSKDDREILRYPEPPLLRQSIVSVLCSQVQPQSHFSNGHRCDAFWRHRIGELFFTVRFSLKVTTKDCLNRTPLHNAIGKLFIASEDVSGGRQNNLPDKPSFVCATIASQPHRKERRNR